MHRHLVSIFLLAASATAGAIDVVPPNSVFGALSDSYISTVGGSVSDSVHADLITDGAPRPGWALLFTDLSVQPIGFPDEHFGHGSARASFAGYTCQTFFSATCYNNALVPIELGLALPLDLSLTAVREPGVILGPTDMPIAN